MIMNEIVFKYGSRFSLLLQQTQGRIQNFKLGGAQLKNLHRAEGGAESFGVFRVKNHDFMPKNHIFSNRSAPETNPMYDPLYSWE